MSTEPSNDQNLYILVGALTGKVESILTAMAVWQQSAQSRDERVERLEQRQTEMEARLITRDDLKPLMAKVDELVASDSARRGGTSAVGAITAQLAPWAAVILALLALVGVGRNRSEIIRQEQRLPPIERTQ